MNPSGYGKIAAPVTIPKVSDVSTEWSTSLLTINDALAMLVLPATIGQEIFEDPKTSTGGYFPIKGKFPLTVTTEKFKDVGGRNKGETLFMYGIFDENGRMFAMSCTVEYCLH